MNKDYCIYTNFEFGVSDINKRIVLFEKHNDLIVEKKQEKLNKKLFSILMEAASTIERNPKQFVMYFDYPTFSKKRE